MQTTVINATEYRDLPLAMLTESKTNPRRTFEDAALKELAESIRNARYPRRRALGFSPRLVQPCPCA